VRTVCVCVCVCVFVESCVSNVTSMYNNNQLDCDCKDSCGSVNRYTHIIAIKLTISANTLTIAPTAKILTYNDRTVTHLHIKWGVSVGPTVIGAGT